MKKNDERATNAKVEEEKIKIIISQEKSTDYFGNRAPTTQTTATSTKENRTTVEYTKIYMNALSTGIRASNTLKITL